ncbi:MAG: hypothetical protein EOO11_07050 [Chitinophagaceae bacterium]|nr:MAG: hypothetical protein EOO11_07050 [Chitinophagaceae bacterium]
MSSSHTPRTMPVVKAGLVVSIAVFLFYAAMLLTGNVFQHPVARPVYELLFLPALVLALCMPLVSIWFLIRKRGSDRRLAALTLAISLFSIALFLMLVQQTTR